ncbi:MAG: multidrug ABC transporter ATP-binding protein [Clostridiales bacterium]|nr:MAG: multidrug ABC transporter ATP-binding protein [Clostridiales bacterium]
MMKLIKIYKPYALWVLVIFALLFVQAMTDLALPDYMSNIVNNGITTGDTGYILQEGGKMLLVALLGAVCTILVGFLSARLAAGTARNLRHDVFRKVERFSNAEFDRFSTASLITRTTNDIQQIQMLSVMALRFVFYAPIMGVGGVVKAVTKSPNLSWIIAVAVLVVIGLVLVLFSLSVPKFKLVQKLVDRLNLVTRESLTGMMVIRAFNTQKREEERFDEVNRDLTKTNLFVNRLMVFMMPVMMFVMNAVQITIIWIGAGQVDAGAIQVGDMMAFMQYAMQIIMSFLMISVMFIMLPRASVSAERINEVLDTEPVIQDKDAPKHFPSDFKGVVEFHNVTFTYPGASEPVLNDINFVAKPGETTAFIGSTGSGKSTLVNLIDRFYDVSTGHISIDGVDIRDVTQHELHEKIGFVPQKGVLFSGTIASNLRYGKEDAAEEELVAASRIAQAAEFIDEKENRYDSDIAQGGGNVSGGQKQRLSIARALVKQAPIYIFDDSFSALDFKTDAALRRALKQETGESTVLIVAQRISTIMGAEQIIVLDEGRIVGKGTHRELLQNCAVYREIAQSQLSEEELEL